jgi:hypothetical protein
MDFSVYHMRADRGALAAHLYVIHRATSTATETGLNDKFNIWLVKLLHRFLILKSVYINWRAVSVNHEPFSNEENG